MNPVVSIVDDDALFRNSQAMLLRMEGFEVHEFESASAFLTQGNLDKPGCLVLDVRMPGMSGLDLQVELRTRHCFLPIIFLTGHGDITMAVHTMQQGAVDFLTKPVDPNVLIATVRKYVNISLDEYQERQVQQKYLNIYNSLTPREQQIIQLVAQNISNKQIATILNIAEPTVKMHRANAFGKFEINSVLEAYQVLEKIGLLNQKGESC